MKILATRLTRSDCLFLAAIGGALICGTGLYSWRQITGRHPRAVAETMQLPSFVKTTLRAPQP